MWLHPNSRAIRLMPQPSAFSRSIAATSSGVRISSPRGTSARETTWFSSDLISTSSLTHARGPVPSVARGPVLHVARYELGAMAPIDLLQDSKEVRASFGPAGVHDQVATGPVERAEHRHCRPLA